MTHQVVCVLQARLSSSRLPAKALLQITGKSLLYHCFNRAIKAGFVADNIYLLTSFDPSDDLLANEFATFSSIKNVFRGDLNNLSRRYLDFCLEKNVNCIVRLTCDNPLTSSSCLQALRFYLKNKETPLLAGHYSFDSSAYSYGEVPDAFVFPSLDALDIESANICDHPIDYLLKVCEGVDTILDLSVSSSWINIEKFLSIDTYDDYVRVARLVAATQGI